VRWPWTRDGTLSCEQAADRINTSRAGHRQDEHLLGCFQRRRRPGDMRARRFQQHPDVGSYRSLSLPIGSSACEFLHPFSFLLLYRFEVDPTCLLRICIRRLLKTALVLNTPLIGDREYTYSNRYGILWSYLLPLAF
jgi:hypothetical protein